jgi:hypothetical protein
MSERKENEKSKRLKDFADRKKSNPSDVILVKRNKWEYITVHPMSNQVSLLKKLHLKKTDCTQVDCYWYTGDDVVFLQVYSRAHLTQREPGLYARWVEGESPMLYLSAYLFVDAISQDILEDTMSMFFKIGFIEDVASKDYLPEHKLILVSKLL